MKGGIEKMSGKVERVNRSEKSVRSRNIYGDGLNEKKWDESEKSAGQEVQQELVKRKKTKDKGENKEGEKQKAPDPKGRGKIIDIAA